MEFQAAFQLDKTTIFEVGYSTVGSNKDPYFSTRAGKLVRSKRDWSTCGQCQERVLPKGSPAYGFYEKWDDEHLHRLDEDKLAELNEDVYKLCQTYNHIYRCAKSFGRCGDGRDIRFPEIVELSKAEPKKAATAAA